ATAAPLLAGLGRDLTALALAGALDPVIGREREIETLLDVLARRRGNSPVLVGPSGVGKTAVVEGLAQRLARGGAGTEGLAGRRLVELSAGAIVSGTGVRGALAEKVRQLREEVAQTGAILFIDEIHAILGGGDAPDDLAQELKAALARGELACVGATTEDEFRKHVERDPALVRRLTPVPVGEPDEATTRAILRGVLPRYATHHGVRFAEAAEASAVTLSTRFLPELRHPDKALAVLDHAAARVSRRGGECVDRAAVAAVIAERAEVPVERLLLEDRERLLQLEARLGERVIGHAPVIGRVAEALRKGAAGLRGRRRPLGTFLFLGPTGVGKTELAKAIHDVFFGGGELTRFDLSEMSEAHGVARLVGAPPGYVGHREGGQLTEAVRRRPYQLVLLDEGRLTDGRGRTVDFTNTIVVMTSNLGVGVKTRRAMGFGADDAPSAGAEGVVAAARAALPPELWNRIDEPLAFAPLTRDEVKRIAALRLRGLAERVRDAHGTTLSWTDADLELLLVRGGYEPSLGARPLERTIAREVEGPLARRILEGGLGASVDLGALMAGTFAALGAC
ncbi:MAG: ATP-dependent Clp protease ATP-binding subunit, partial [Myxococcota bacterium]